MTNPDATVTTHLYTRSDVMFFIKSLHNHHDGFNINNYIKFATDNTHLASSNKLHQTIRIYKQYQQTLLL